MAQHSDLPPIYHFNSGDILIKLRMRWIYVFFSLLAKINALTGKIWEIVLEFPCTVSALREEGIPPIHSCLKGKMLGMGSNADTSEGVSRGDPTHTSSF